MFKTQSLTLHHAPSIQIYCTSVYLWRGTRIRYASKCLFKPGACRPVAGVCLVSRNHFHAAKVCVCVYVCVCPPLRP